MKRNSIIIAAVLVSLCSCTKEQQNGIKVITDFPIIETICDVEPPVVSMDTPETKVYGWVADPVNNPGKHSIAWKAGDEISAFSIVSNNTAKAELGTILNFSSYRSALVGEDGSTTFKFVIPDLKSFYGADSGVQSYFCALYPATTIDKIDLTLDGNKMDVVLTPDNLIIPDEQDGTGWKYSVFMARGATLSAQYNNPNGGTPKNVFFLASTLIRLQVNSTKNITKVVLSNDVGFMTGEVETITMGSFHYAQDIQKNTLLATGCSGKTLTLDNGGILPNDLYFAVRELREGATYTLTFTAEDGTTMTRSFSNPAGWSNRKTKKVLSLGTITLDSWE